MHACVIRAEMNWRTNHFCPHTINQLIEFAPSSYADTDLVGIGRVSCVVISYYRILLYVRTIRTYVQARTLDIHTYACTRGMYAPIICWVSQCVCGVRAGPDDAAWSRQ